MDAWQLEAAGYTTMLQAWDFVPGSNFVLEIDKAAQQAKRTIAVLSPSYLAASFPQPEWGSAFADDPTAARRKLVPVRVAECHPPGLLGQIVHTDLIGLEEAQVRERLLAGMRERLKPSEAPAFPGADRAGEASPSFPGEREQTHASAIAAPATQSAGPRTWVKIDDVITAVDKLDDTGETITLKGHLDEETLRRLDALRQRGSGNPRGREYFLGQTLPASLRLLEHMADPGLDRHALAQAFVLDDPAAREIIRLLLVEALLGKAPHRRSPASSSAPAKEIPARS